jgi:chromosome segregation ATPase
MAGGKLKNRSNRNQGYLASSEPNSPTIASPEYTITPEKQEMDLKSFLMVMMEDLKKEIQESTGKQLEAFKEEAQKSLKELQENTIKQVMELNKTIQDLKMKVETIKKTQRETTLQIETLGKKSGTIDMSISNRIQEKEERISGAEDSIENMDTAITENAKCKKILTQNIQEIQDTMRKPNLQIIGVDENEDFQLKGPADIFNKIIKENFPYLKRCP